MMEALLREENGDEAKMVPIDVAADKDTDNMEDETGGEEEDDGVDQADDEESITEQELLEDTVSDDFSPLLGAPTTTHTNSSSSSRVGNLATQHDSYDKFDISFTADDPLINVGTRRSPYVSAASMAGKSVATGASTTTPTDGKQAPRQIPMTFKRASTRSTLHHEVQISGSRRDFVLKRQDSQSDLTKISKVERSWFVIADAGRIAHVGETIFLNMFEEYPDLVKLFPFGSDDALYDDHGRLLLRRLNKSNTIKLHIRAHASAVMRVVGMSVAGLTSIGDIVPKLRAVGATHKTVGVQSFHYDILFRHLVSAIKEEVIASDPNGWDADTEEAWCQAYQSIVDLIKRPSKRLETEPLRGWGAVMLVACMYFSLVTPMRFGGFFIGFPALIVVLDILDFLAAAAMAVDLALDFIQNRFRLSSYRFIQQRDELSGESESEDIPDSVDSSCADVMQRSSHRKAQQKDQMESKTILRNSHSVRRRGHSSKLRSSTSILWLGLEMIAKRRRRVLKSLSHWKMDHWVPWPSLDVRVLLSFVLQGIIVDSSICSNVGLHWTQLIGLLRVSCASRVLHFVQCAENSYLLSQMLDAQNAMRMRIVKLIIRLAFITHICACMYCTVARFELGYNATEFVPTSFFPNIEVLYGPNRQVLASYSKALHWAFVSLSGIGNTESIPQTSLECMYTISVHMIGAIFYAIVTGTVITILEDAVEQENKMGEDMVKLSNFLTTARMSMKSKERIMKGYVFRNILTEGGGSNSTEAQIEGLLEGKGADEILGTLPNYLKMEVGIYARAELLHRREHLFLHCSNSFLVSLSSNLNRTRTLLSGDYLIQEGERVQDEFVVIEKGSLQVRMNGNTIKTLIRGHCIGKSWLLQMHPSPFSFGPAGSKDPQHNFAVSEHTDWIRGDGTSGVTIRALGPCVLITGLQTAAEVKQLEESYQVDFQLLRAEVRGAGKDDGERKAKAMRGIAKAVRRFKERRCLQRVAMNRN